MESIKGYIVENGKRINFITEGDNKIIFSDKKEAVVSLMTTDFKKAYATALLPVVQVPSAPDNPNYIEYGDGKGRLDIISIKDTIVKVKPGTYNSITIKKSANLVVLMDAVTLTGGSVDIDNCSGIQLIAGSFVDCGNGAVHIDNYVNNLSIRNCNFHNIKSYVINYGCELIFNGKDETASKDWLIEGCSFENTNQIFNSKSDLKPDGVMTLMRNFKFLNNTVKNCPNMGSIVSIGAVDGYEIAGNIIDNVNMLFPDSRVPNGPHNGLFTMVGWGSCHNNKLTNHQGNLIRAWGVSFDTQVREILIYNNKVHNSWKYSAFELQVPPYISEYKAKFPARVFYTNAKVYSNTAGHLSVSKDWDGQMLDLYNTYGTVEYYNNIGFDMVASNPVYHPVSNMINNNYDQDKTRLVESNNKYFATAAQAVEDTINFKSKISGIGAQ